jgi:hypothetical protein
MLASVVRMRSALAKIAMSLGAAACLADIPELRTTSNGGQGGADGTVSSSASGSASNSTSASTSLASSAATGFCASRPAGDIVCEDFDATPTLPSTWMVVAPTGVCHVEVDEAFASSLPRSLHAWVDEQGGAGGAGGAGGGCHYAKLIYSIPGDPGDLRLDLDVRSAQVGVVATLEWEASNGIHCRVLVYNQLDRVEVHLQQDPELPLNPSFHFSPPPGALEDFRAIGLEIRRGRAPVSFEMTEPPVQTFGDPSTWDACVTASPFSQFELELGAHCVGPASDPETDSHFDNVALRPLP